MAVEIPAISATLGSADRAPSSDTSDTLVVEVLVALGATRWETARCAGNHRDALVLAQVTVFDRVTPTRIYLPLGIHISEIRSRLTL